MTYDIRVDYLYIEHIDETDYPDITFNFTGDIRIANKITDNKYYVLYIK